MARYPVIGKLGWFGLFVEAAERIPPLLARLNAKEGGSPFSENGSSETHAQDEMEELQDILDVMISVVENHPETLGLFQEAAGKLELASPDGEATVVLPSIHQAILFIAFRRFQLIPLEESKSEVSRSLVNLTDLQREYLKTLEAIIPQDTIQPLLQIEAGKAFLVAKRVVRETDEITVFNHDQTAVIGRVKPPLDYKRLDLLFMTGLSLSGLAELYERPDGYLFLWSSPSVNDLDYPSMRKTAVLMSRLEFTTFWFTHFSEIRPEIAHLIDLPNLDEGPPLRAFARGTTEPKDDDRVLCVNDEEFDALLFTMNRSETDSRQHHAESKTSTVKRRTEALPAPEIGPRFDKAKRELYFDGHLARKIRPNQGENIVCILSCFEDDEWPTEIEDPLTGVHDQDPKRRLNSAIASLNKDLKSIRFRGNGKGDGVIWEVKNEATAQ